MLFERTTTAGMVWVCWPKKASKMPTDLDENKVRDLGLELGFVDVKVAAIEPVGLEVGVEDPLLVVERPGEVPAVGAEDRAAAAAEQVVAVEQLARAGSRPDSSARWK